MLSPEMLARIAQEHNLLKTSAEVSKPAATSIVAKGFLVTEVVASAGLTGYINGRFASAGKDHLAILDIPVDVTAGFGVLLASLFGSFGEFDMHMAAVAAGIGGGVSYRMLFAKGAAARVEQEEGKKLLANSNSKKGLGEGATRTEGADVIPLQRTEVR